MNYLSINAFDLARLTSVSNRALHAQESSLKASFSSSAASCQKMLIIRVSGSVGSTHRKVDSLSGHGRLLALQPLPNLSDDVPYARLLDLLLGARDSIAYLQNVSTSLAEVRS